MILFKRISLFALFFLLACGTQIHSKKVVRNNIEMLYGPVSAEQLYFDYPQWQEKEQAYQLQEKILTKLKTLQKPFKVKVFLATWCPDSRREVPHFFKILRESGLAKQATVEMWAVDRKLKTVDKLSDTYAIRRVPTFIFFRDGKEIGRIVETPRALYLEEDMLSILKGH